MELLIFVMRWKNAGGEKKRQVMSAVWWKPMLVWIHLLKTEGHLSLHSIPWGHAVTAASLPLGTPGLCRVLGPATTRECWAPLQLHHLGLLIPAGAHWKHAAASRAEVGFHFAFQENSPATTGMVCFYEKEFHGGTRSDLSQFPDSILLN